MYCTKCGAKNPESANFCHNCGEKLMPAPKPADVSVNPPIKEAQTSYYAFSPAQDFYKKEEKILPPECSQLGWHKFLIYFLLIVEAIYYLFVAYSYISGTGFGADRDYIYTNFPDVVKVVKINGYLYLVLGLYTLSVRSSLSKFKSGAPGKLTLMYVFSALLALAGNFMISPAFGSVSESPSLIITPIIYALFWICINHAYYKKREKLFIS